MNYRQVACQQEPWIGLEIPHTMLIFLKKIWLRNKDAWTHGQHWKQILIGPWWESELEWVTVWWQKVLGCRKPLALLIDQNESSIYFGQVQEQNWWGGPKSGYRGSLLVSFCYFDHRFWTIFLQLLLCGVFWTCDCLSMPWKNPPIWNCVSKQLIFCGVQIQDSYRLLAFLIHC